VTDRPEEDFVSVTRLIDMYSQPYDSDFWSSYKALEAADADMFAIYKHRLLSTHCFDIDVTAFADRFQEEKKKILRQWDATREESVVRGTEHHLKREEKCRAHPTEYVQELGFEGDFVLGGEDIDLQLENAVYPELIVHRISEDRRLRIAGQSDLVIIEKGKYLSVLDYKSSRTIDRKSFFDSTARRYTMMLPPVNMLQDCNFIHYSLQLSLYAWMIKKAFPHLEVKTLKIIHTNHKGKTTVIPCQYLEMYVVRMLKHYKRSLSDAA
jgi:hypothetical protein